MPSRPPFSPTVALAAIAREHDAAFTAALKPLGLSVRKYGMLGHLARNPGISFSELARRAHITVQSAHTAIAGLVQAGLVQDSTAHAGAASTLTLTSTGVDRLASAAIELDRLDAELTAKYPSVVRGLRADIAPPPRAAP